KGHCVLVPTFWFLCFVSCDLVLRFGPAFCLKTSYVLPKDKLRFAARHVAFCFKARCILLQDSCVLLRSSLHFASKLVVFCFKTSCILLHDSCVQVKTMKIQAGIQVSRPRELRRQLQLWKRFGRLHLIVFVLVRNIVSIGLEGPPSSHQESIRTQA
nr:hypothetical protein [Tanacetum cinerariifolium]